MGEETASLGVEITSKTLGVIGCGNVGAIVANRAIGLKMKVIAYDPFLAPERAAELGRGKSRSPGAASNAPDFVTLHTPLTDKTKGIIDGKAIAAMKKGVRIINCARGGLVDEGRLTRRNLDSGHVAGAAPSTWFTEEAGNQQPAVRAIPNVVCTPHLGAAHHRGAGKRRHWQVAEQMSDYLLRGAISNAVKLPLDHSRGSARGCGLSSSWRKKLGSFRRPADREPAIHKAQLVLRRRGRRHEHQGGWTSGRHCRPSCGPCCKEVNVVFFLSRADRCQGSRQSSSKR